MTVAPDNQGHKRYRCNRRGRDQCTRGVSIRVADLDAIVTERFLNLAGNLYAADVQEVTTAPDAARRADLAEAIRQAERAMSAADDADDEAAFTAARALRRSLRAELDALPTAAVVTRQRVISSSTYAERWTALADDNDARRELLRPLVTVTVAPATERTATGHYDTSPDTLARRVRTGWADELTAAAVDALEDELSTS